MRLRGSAWSEDSRLGDSRTRPGAARDAGRPAGHADPDAVFVHGNSDLDDVRWLTRSDIDSLMPETYQPVLAYLDRDQRGQLGLATRRGARRSKLRAAPEAPGISPHCSV